MPADIQHVVVLMLENRSFDHIFGFRSGVDGLKGSETNLLDPSQPVSPTNPLFKVSNAEPYSISAGEGPSHAFNAVNTQIYGAKEGPLSGNPAANSGFVQSYRESLNVDHVSNPTFDQMRVVMEAFAPGTLPALEALADAFCVCDRWFCEVPGPTMPNRMFIHMATSAGFVHNVWHNTFQNKTIYNSLEEVGKTWATYDFDQNEVRQLAQVRDKTACFKSFETDFQADVTGGALPNYSFIVPRFFSKNGPVNSMHGPYDARPADQLIADVYNALRSSPEVWNKSVLIVTMDEHGGFYDHVIPPAASNPDGINSPPPGDSEPWVPAFQFDRLGLRVPTVIASPWIAAGKVDSTPYQHTSVLATLKNLFGLTGFLTHRDAEARSFDTLFSEATPRTDTPQTISSTTSVATPRTFASGSTQDHTQFGLDSLQQEMVHGVDALTQPDSSKLLSLGGLPDTQGDAADFLRRRIGSTFGAKKTPATAAPEEGG